MSEYKTIAHVGGRMQVRDKDRLRQLEHERLAEAIVAFIEGRAQLGYSSLDVPLTLKLAEEREEKSGGKGDDSIQN